MTAPRRSSGPGPAKPRQHLIPVGQIASMLADRIDSLARELFPRGRKDGHEWRVGSLAGEPGQSLGIHLSQDKPGVWRDFSAGKGGDALDLVAQARFGGNMTEAIKWAKGWLGLDGTDWQSLKTTRASVAQSEERQRQAEDEAKKKRDRALAIWLDGKSGIAFTPAGLYLQGRGLDLQKLPGSPNALRFHEALWCEEVRGKYPAMVAIINSLETGQPIAVHRTWLQALPGGHVVKAPVNAPKKVLGAMRGGVISLWKGVTVDPETGELKKNKSLSDVKVPVWVNLTEGIEDGLTIALAMPEARVMAGVSIGNMKALRWPAQVGGLVLWRQNDEPGSPADIAFQDMVKNVQAQGKRVKIPTMPQGVKDPNELVVVSSNA